MHIASFNCSEELNALESGCPNLLAVLYSLNLLSIKIDFKVLEDTSKMASIWHMLNSFSTEVRKCWQVEILHLVKNTINHNICKFDWSFLYQQICVNEVLICERGLCVLFWLQNSSEKQVNHLPRYP